ncbi:hypothetical protein [Streptomyces sp. NPDC003077]|uniref:hypothetical protein n=1 Tax=Streptomyces sp. NPDC003077 TaxID=3154443 RepID=UPI0033B67FF5
MPVMFPVLAVLAVLPSVAMAEIGVMADMGAPRLIKVWAPMFPTGIGRRPWWPGGTARRPAGEGKNFRSREQDPAGDLSETTRGATPP